MNAQNNTLGLNSNLVAAILTIADNLRSQYGKIGATNYQNPRNPFPIHKLVINALPTSKRKAMTYHEIRRAIQASGYHVHNNGTADKPTYIYLSTALGNLVKGGAVKRIGQRGSYRYWFAF